MKNDAHPPQKTQTYRDVQNEVIKRINSRHWAPGDLMPGEIDLAKEFGCARPTVNRALRELADAGLLVRRRRAGTFIALNPSRRAQVRIPLTRKEIEGRGADYGYVLLHCARRKPTVTVFSQLGLPEKTDMLHLRALHLADRRPYQYEERWINIAAVPEVVQAPLKTISANEWLVRNSPFAAGNISYFSAAASAEEAKILDVKPGVALFIAERITWNDSTPITLARLAHPPGHRVAMTI